MLENVMDFQNKAMNEMPALEEQAEKLIKDGKTDEAKQLVTDYTHDFFGASARRWKELEEKFWGWFGRGF
jgi:predicted transcriptional regulator